MFSCLLAIVLVAGEAVLSDAQGWGRRNPCEPNICQNGGTCVFPLDYPICQCRSGFAGTTCERRVSVKPGTCANSQNPDEGTCVKTCSSDYDCSGSKKCCPTFCQSTCTDSITFNTCRAGACLNGGTCTAPFGTPICRCPVGYTGARCENARHSGGSCPVIRPGLAGACGGRFCSTDKHCKRGEKCCQSACGGRLCTAV